MCKVCGGWHGLRYTCAQAKELVEDRSHWHVPDLDGECHGFDDDGQPMCPRCKRGHPIAITCRMAVEWRTWVDAQKPTVPTPAFEAMWGEVVSEARGRAVVMNQLENRLSRMPA